MQPANPIGIPTRDASDSLASIHRVVRSPAERQDDPTLLRRILRVGVLLAVALTASPSLAGIQEWTAAGPSGGVVLDLARDAVDPNVLYAATEGAGLWKSTDGAESWRPLDLGGTGLRRQNLSLVAHPSRPGVLHVSTVDGVYRTTDGGQTWGAVAAGLPFVGKLAAAPSDGDVLYYGGFYEGLYRSTDGGVHWAATNFAVDGHFFDVVVDPQNADRVYVNLGSGQVYKSVDGGDLWQLINQGLPTDSAGLEGNLAIDPLNSDHLLLVLGGDLYRSLNDGLSWTQIATFDQGYFRVDFDPRLPGRVYLGLNLKAQVYRSDDGGVTWQVGILDHPAATTTDFVFGAPGTETVWLGDLRGDGVYRSDDGLTWQLANQHLDASTATDFAFDPASSTAYVATRNGIHRRTGPGQPWELLNASRSQGLCCEHIVVDPQQPQVLYAGSGIRGVLKSLDGGASWQVANTGRESSVGVYDLVMDPTDSSKLYLGAFDGVYRSTDGAETWHRMDDTTIDSQVWIVRVDPETPSTVYAATRVDLFKSFDGGSTWSLASAAGPGFFNDLVLDPFDPTTVYAVTPNGLFRSTDGGVLWRPLAAEGLPITRYETLRVDPADPNTLYVGIFDGVWWSTDGGVRFEPFEGGARDAQVLALGIDGGPVRTFYAGFENAATASLTRGCIDSTDVLCLDDRTQAKRFAVRIAYDTALGGGFRGDAEARSLSPIGIDDGGVFSFFDPGNPEALVKIIDACGFNERYWVFAAATTSVGFELTVEDTLTRETKTYTNPDDHPAATITDIDAFATCPSEATESATSVSPEVPETRSWEVVATGQRGTRRGTTRSESGSCVADATTLCIDDAPGDRRFAVRLHFDSVLGGGTEGDAMATSLAPLGITDGGILSFFSLALPEVLVKVIDGCGFNDNFWVFYAATTNLGFELTVEDTHTGTTKVYTNPDTVPAETVTDIEALATCG